MLNVPWRALANPLCATVGELGEDPVAEITRGIEQQPPLGVDPAGAGSVAVDVLEALEERGDGMREEEALGRDGRHRRMGGDDPLKPPGTASASAEAEDHLALQRAVRTAGAALARDRIGDPETHGAGSLQPALAPCAGPPRAGRPAD